MTDTNYMITNGDGTITYSGMSRDRAFARAQEKANEHQEPFFVSPEGYESDDDSDLGEQVDPQWTVKVAAVRPADEGAVDADIIVTIGDESHEGEVTLYPERGRPTVRRRHPLGTCGTPLEVWASAEIIDGLAAADAAGIDRRDVIGTIEAAVTHRVAALPPSHVPTHT